jgi:hypothetical protein
MKPSGWPIYIVTLLFGVCLAVMSQSKALSTLVAKSAAECGSSGCITCVPDTCNPLQPGQVLVDGPNEEGERCVEYDGNPPPHCATVVIDNKTIWTMDPYELQGTCSLIDCANGSPTAEVCTQPWVKPPDHSDPQLQGALQ